MIVVAAFVLAVAVVGVTYYWAVLFPDQLRDLREMRKQKLSYQAWLRQPPGGMDLPEFDS